MSGDSVDKLYENYNTLDAAKDDITKFESHYVSILSAVKGSSQEKRLASQFIAKFFPHFPQHHESAIDSLLDLCEDDDTTIRRHAIKELPSICRDRKEYVPKIADVLAQLLQTEDQTELTIVNQSLMTLSKYDVKGFLGGLFSQIIGGDDIVRERSITFLRDKIKLLPNDVINKDIEEFLLQECRKVMADVTKDEFIIFMTLLASLKMSKTIAGQQILLEIVKEQAEIGVHFEHTDVDFIDKLVMCMKHAVQFFSQFVPSTEFVAYVCTEVIPHLDQMTVNQQEIDLEILQLLAEMIPYVSPNAELIDIEKCHTIIFNKLLQYMPLPPEVMTQETATIDEPTLQLTHVECLLYSFVQLGKHNTQFLSDVHHADRVKDFKLRLQYSARGVQSYINKLRKHLQTVKGEALRSDENKLKVMALKTTTNINTLIRDLFKSPPNYKTVIQLSWKPLASVNRAVASPGAVETPLETSKPTDDGTLKNPKRKIITAPEGTGPKRERPLYAPPGGKFSTNASRGGFRGRGRGGFGKGFRGGMRRGGRGFIKRFQNYY